MDPLNIEFIRLLSESGWTQAQAARELRLDPGTITYYVQGKTRPSPTVLRLFKMSIGDATPIPGERETTKIIKGPFSELENWEQEIVTELRNVEPEIRKRVLPHIKALIVELPKAKADVRRKGGK